MEIEAVTDWFGNDDLYEARGLIQQQAEGSFKAGYETGRGTVQIDDRIYESRESAIEVAHETAIASLA